MGSQVQPAEPEAVKPPSDPAYQRFCSEMLYSFLDNHTCQEMSETLRSAWAMLSAYEKAQYAQRATPRPSRAPRTDYDAPMWMAYHEHTVLPALKPGDMRRPLPFGAVVVDNAADGGVAARIPEQWPLRIHPSQFVIASGRKMLRNAYELGDVSRQTTAKALIDDLIDFLGTELKAQLQSAVDVHLLRATPKANGDVQYAVAPHDANAVDLDLFNLAANNESSRP